MDIDISVHFRCYFDGIRLEKFFRAGLLGTVFSAGRKYSDYWGISSRSIRILLHLVSNLNGEDHQRLQADLANLLPG